MSKVTQQVHCGSWVRTWVPASQFVCQWVLPERAWRLGLEDRPADASLEQWRRLGAARAAAPGLDYDLISPFVHI